MGRPTDMRPFRRTRASLVTMVAAMVVTGALAACSESAPPEEVRAGQPGASSPASPGGPTVPPTGAGATTTSPSPAPGNTARPVSPDEPASSDGSSSGDGSTSSGPLPPYDPSTDPSRVAGTPPANAEGDIVPVTTVPGDRRRAHPWDGYTVAADNRTLTLTYYAGVEPCSTFDSVVADEGADSVRVTIYERSGPDGVACIALAQQKSATVTLAAPLGGRSVLDGTRS